jgi:hypothetical protein
MPANHWTADKSLTLSLLSTWAALIGAVLAGIGLPFLPRLDYRPNTILFDSTRFLTYAPSIYTCLAIGVFALAVLLRLLHDIARGLVFTADNVRRIRLVAWCALLIGGVCLLSALLIDHRPTVVVIGLAAIFCGIVARVIKNVIDAARLLKEDADYTI